MFNSAGDIAVLEADLKMFLKVDLKQVLKIIYTPYKRKNLIFVAYFLTDFHRDYMI